MSTVVGVRLVSPQRCECQFVTRWKGWYFVIRPSPLVSREPLARLLPYFFAVKSAYMVLYETWTELAEDLRASSALQMWSGEPTRECIHSGTHQTLPVIGKLPPSLEHRPQCQETVWLLGEQSQIVDVWWVNGVAPDRRTSIEDIHCHLSGKLALPEGLHIYHG